MFWLLVFCAEFLLPGHQSDSIYFTKSGIIYGVPGNYRFVNFDGDFCGILQNSTDRLVGAFEMDGYLVTSFLTEQGESEIQIHKSGNLVSSTTGVAICPNLYKNSLWVFDYSRLVKSNVPYPFIAQEAKFEHGVFRFTQNEMIKAPNEQLNTNFNFKNFWLIELNDLTYVVFSQGTIIELDPNYLNLEVSDGSYQIGRHQEKSIKLPGGYINQGPYKLPEIMSKALAKEHLINWASSKTTILGLAKGIRGVVLAWGPSKKPGFHLGILNPDLTVSTDRECHGLFLGISKDTEKVWTYERTADGLIVMDLPTYK